MIIASLIILLIVFQHVMKEGNYTQGRIDLMIKVGRFYFVGGNDEKIIAYI